MVHNLLEGPDRTLSGILVSKKPLMSGPGPTSSPDRTGFPPIFFSPLNEERGEKKFLGIPRGRKLGKNTDKTSNSSGARWRGFVYKR